MRVRSSGYRSFVWQGFKNGRPARISIGPVALKTIEEARQDCLALMVQERSGDRKADAVVPLFSDFATGPWKEAIFDHCKPRRRADLAQELKRQLLPSFGSLRLDHIGPRHVEAWFDAYSQVAPSGANNTLETLRRIMKFAVESGHISSDPTRSVKRNRRPPLTRFLSRQEIARLYKTLDRMVAKRPSCQLQADMIRLLLLTGCRRNEITRLRWCEVRGATLRLTDSKDRTARSLAVNHRPGTCRASTSARQRLGVSLAARSCEAVRRRYDAMVQGPQGGWYRGCSLA